MKWEINTFLNEKEKKLLSQLKKMAGLTSGNKLGHSAMCWPRITAAGDRDASAVVILLK